MKLTYPGADAKTQWWSGDFTSDKWTSLEKLVLHTTEGHTWPTYVRDGKLGALAPNATGRPDIQHQKMVWRAHFDACESARALRNEPGGVLTNTDRAHQIELVGTCDPDESKKWQRQGLKPDVDYIEWWRPPLWALIDVARYCLWLHEHCGLDLTVAQPWVAFPGSFGTKARQRMSNADWNSFRGICGHEHAAENVHGDPGAFPGDALLAHLRALSAPAQPTAQKPPPNAPPVVHHRGAPMIAIQLDKEGRVYYLTDNGDLVYEGDPHRLGAVAGVLGGVAKMTRAQAEGLATMLRASRITPGPLAQDIARQVLQGLPDDHQIDVDTVEQGVTQALKNLVAGQVDQPPPPSQ